MNTKQPEIYLFSGLGADERVFQYLDFGDRPVHYVKWLKPENKEPLSFYAKRISASIKTSNPILIGLSFGGMVAVEVAKYISVEQIILISSAKNRKEIPFLYRMIGKLGLHNIVPTNLLKKGGFLMNWMFGVKAQPEKNLLKSIILDTDEAFLKWAINALLKWDNEELPLEVKHIHGTRDRLLPIKNLKADVVMEGGHFIIISQQNKIQTAINQILEEIK